MNQPKIDPLNKALSIARKIATVYPEIKDQMKYIEDALICSRGLVSAQNHQILDYEHRLETLMGNSKALKTRHAVQTL